MINIKERPVVFTAEEVNAVLAGDKTQHRIIIENTKDTQCLFSGDWRYDGRDFLDDSGCIPNPKGAHYVERLELERGEDHQYTEDYQCIGHCPLGSIGERLWVQEDFIPDPPAGHDAWEDEDSVTNFFQWDGCGNELSEIPKRLRNPEHVIYEASSRNPDSMIWVNAKSLPRWASRLLLEITDIRIERVTDITHNDSVAEYCFNFGEKRQQSIPPLTGFAKYWIEKHGNNAWRSNPWIWVIEFKVIKEGLL